MKVLWTDSAVAQLQAIHDYVAQTSPDYAVCIVDRLTRRSIQIAAFPNSGRMVPIVGAYALAAHGFPRATGDIDIWVRNSSDNATRVMSALAKFGAPLSGRSDYSLGLKPTLSLKSLH